MTEVDIVKLTEDLLNYHKTPIRKFELKTKKFFICSSSESEQRLAFANKHLEELKTYLKRIRVERRCVRAQANWLPNDNKAEIKKITKNIANFGFQNKFGKFLNPEEVLYLVETNKLEVMYNSIPCSIQDCYQIIFNDKHFKCNKYVAIKQLFLQGYKPIKKQLPPRKGKRRNKFDNTDIPNKTLKFSNTRILNIFDKINKKAPKKLELMSEPHNSNYLFQLNTNNPIHLVISDAKKFNDLPNFSNISDVYALGLEYFIGYYQFLNINLPIQ